MAKKKTIEEKTDSIAKTLSSCLHILALVFVGWHSLKVPGLMNKLSVLESVSQGHEKAISLHRDRLEVNTWHANVIEHDLKALNQRVSFLEHKTALSVHKNKKGNK